jgi:hypothetical protein
MKRKVNIDVDPNRFPNNRRPHGYGKLAARADIDVRAMLLHTAVWTRPPTMQGFHLADCWAWLRYANAFDSSADLRLRPEWNDVDPHQKTILSDELGVGVATYLLADTLGFQRFVDTNYMIRTLAPAQFRLLRCSKRGSAKSPDYIGVDASGRFVALECKGTQSSLGALQSAMQGGVVQKRNLAPKQGTRIHLGLVSGLFIPQAHARELASVVFWDPTWDDFADLVTRIPAERFTATAVRGSLAKQLALAGLKHASQELSVGVRDSWGPFSVQARAELASLQDGRVVFDTSQLVERGAAVPNASLKVKASKRLAALSRSDDDALREFANESAAKKWTHQELDGSAVVGTPDGLHLTFQLTQT